MTQPTKPKVLVTGAGGQLGLELVRALSPLAEVVATTRDGTPASAYALDLCDEEAIGCCIQRVAPEVVFNAAAYTQVDKAESEPLLAAAVNTTAPALLAQACSQTGALLVHYSTDYVFDGEAQRAYVESDPTSPINVYGRTKLDGELEVAKHLQRHFVFRTSWVYATHGSNFVCTMYRRAQAGQDLQVVDDQRGAPTSAAALAQAAAALLGQIGRQGQDWVAAHAGTYHLTAMGSCTWFELARHVVQSVDPTVKVTAIASSDYPTPARRPRFSVLDCQRASDRLGLSLPDWEHQLEPVLQQLGSRT